MDPVLTQPNWRLGLVLNIVILWNIRSMQRALNAYHAAGGDMRAEDVARLSPLGLDHITILGPLPVHRARVCAGR